MILTDHQFEKSNSNESFQTPTDQRESTKIIIIKNLSKISHGVFIVVPYTRQVNTACFPESWGIFFHQLDGIKLDGIKVVQEQ